LKLVKHENKGTKKIITEMLNTRLIVFEKKIDDFLEGLVKKLQI
jgi:hypothetical protein